MKKHREINEMMQRWAGTGALCLGILSLAGFTAGAQNATNVARVSFIQGSVQLSAGQGTDFQQAVMNMPLLDGSTLQTGGDGQVEVEFGDGSVARLTPSSSLQIDHLGQDQVQLEQTAGLGYYELNVGNGRPPFFVQFSGVSVQPTANSIVRVGLDSGWEVAVVSGSISVQGNGMPPANVAENQSIHSTADNSTPYSVAQGINGDSWDNWNQDRDQAIAQEAANQTPVRDDSANPQSENWNDLDADGNWYPVEGSGNVWVPAGVGADWDPYGAGYWGYYPTMGYTWISAYPWGWLPYHCGAWNYYQFGWGWSPGGGCGRVWSPVIVVRSHPPGWVMPIRPIRPPGGIYPLPGQRLVAVDRGAAARGPWGFRGPAPRPDHMQSLNFRGAAIMPVQRVDVRSQGFTAARGTSPGTRAVLSVGPAFQPSRVGNNSVYTHGPAAGQPANTHPAFQQPAGQSRMQSPPPQAPVQHPAYQPPPAQSRMQNPAVRPNEGYQGNQNFGQQRSNYAAHEPAPTVHYSPPPAAAAPHYQAPPPAAHGGPGGGGHR